MSKKSIPRKVVARRAGDVQSSVAATDRAKSELGWETDKTLLDACQDTWDYLGLRNVVRACEALKVYQVSMPILDTESWTWHSNNSNGVYRHLNRRF